MKPFLLLFLLLIPSICAAEDPKFLSSIIKHMDERPNDFSDSFAFDDSFFAASVPIVRHKIGPSRDPLVPRKNELLSMIQTLKNYAGTGVIDEKKRMLKNFEDTFGSNYLLRELPPCRDSRIITREAKRPSLIASAIRQLYFDGSSASDRRKTYRFGGDAIPYPAGKTISQAHERHRLPLYLSEAVGITCLPTYVKSKGIKELEFHEGDSAWQVELEEPSLGNPFIPEP